MFDLYFKVLFLNGQCKTSNEGGTVLPVINESLKRGIVFVHQLNNQEGNQNMI